MSPTHHVTPTVEDESDMIPMTQVIWLHVVIRMWDVQTTLGQRPGVVTVVLTHAAGEAFEAFVEHGIGDFPDDGLDVATGVDARHLVALGASGEEVGDLRVDQLTQIISEDARKVVNLRH